NQLGMRQMVQHLASLGHRRIAYLGHPLSLEAARERFEGFEFGLRDCGLALAPELIENTVSALAYSARNLEQLVNRTTDFTALVCYNDTIAMQAVRWLEARNLRVPRDISIAGFDDVSVPADFPLPITSIAFDRHAMGRRAVMWIYENFEKVALPGER